VVVEEILTPLGRIGVAAVLGGIIGFDRELRGHAAGLRTNILVAAAAAVFADVSVNGFAELRGYDPSRVAADVVSGIGFIGAGAIFAARGRPRGLTTAAALWASAAIGLAVGVGRWEVAVGLVAMSIVVLSALNAVADRVLSPTRSIVRDLYVVVAEPSHVEPVQRHLLDHGVRIQRLKMAQLHDSIGVDLTIRGLESDLEDALSLLYEVEGVAFASDEEGIVDGG
jgi:putative Mg2+ transporter-C (MgtC) family protein